MSSETSNLFSLFIAFIRNIFAIVRGAHTPPNKPPVVQTANELNTHGANSPSIIANGNVTLNIGVTQKPQRETILKQTWHNPKTRDGVIAPLQAESTETKKVPFSIEDICNANDSIHDDGDSFYHRKLM